MRARRWVEQAQVSQVVTTAIAGVVLLVLAVIVAIPDRDSGSDLLSGLPQLPAEAGGVEATAVPLANGDVAGSSAPAGSAPGVTGQARGGAASAPRAQGGATSGTGASSSGGGPAADEATTASDRGITEESIKVGFTISRTANVSATGFALGLRQDQEEVIAALVRWANERGGALGRKITYVTAQEDPTNASTWQTTCIRMTEDEEVFAVLSPASHLGAGNLCYITHGMPHINSGGVTVAASMFDQGRGYLVSTAASGTRAALNWADAMLREGAIGKGKGKVGLLTDDCPQGVEMIDDGLKPFLDDAGVDYVEARTSCDLGAAQQQIPAAVLNLRQSGVDRVFLGVIFTTAQTFMQQAEAQGWRPTYLVSDVWGNNTDFLAQNFPPEQFDRTRATAFSHSGEEPAGVPYSEPTQQCSAILEDAGLPPITEQMGTDAEIVSHCDNFFLLLKVLSNLPRNPIRAQWPAAVAAVGEIQSAYADTARFVPMKYDGGDTYALVEWRRECSCWVQIRPHQPGRF